MAAGQKDCDFHSDASATRRGERAEGNGTHFRDRRRSGRWCVLIFLSRLPHRLFRAYNVLHLDYAAQKIEKAKNKVSGSQGNNNRV